MPETVGAGIVYLWGAAGATAASAAAAGAVATAVTSAVIAGAVTGAVIGAATSLATGGDFLQGTLKGAFIGGVTAGLFKGASIAWSGLDAAATAEVSAAAEYGEQVPGATTSEAVKFAKDYVSTPIGGNAGGVSGAPPLASKEIAALPADERVTYMQNQWRNEQTLANKEALKSTAVIGAAQGVGTGLLQVAGAKIGANARSDEMEKLQEQKAAGSVLGKYVPRDRFNFKLPESWITAVSSPLSKYQNKPPGLLATPVGGAS